MLEEEGPPDPKLLDGSSWDRRRYTDEVDRRIRWRQEILLHDIGIRREDFDLAQRLLSNTNLRARVEAIMERTDLPELLKQLEAIRREESAIGEAWLRERVSRCERCGSLDADWYKIRRTRRLCEPCAESLFRRLRKTSTNIGPALATARRLDLPATLTLDEWTRTIEHFKDCCAYCGKDWDVVEHVTPSNRAGGTTFTNCLPSCHSCNRFKGSKTLEEWIMKYPGERLRAALDWLVQNGRNPS
jgi:hypothetical protein